MPLFLGIGIDLSSVADAIAGIPATALLDEDGNPILDENGDYILGEE